jgi:hypothetical protein
MSDDLIKVQGHNGQLEMSNSMLRILRKGFLAFMTQGLKGDKEILLSQITSVQFKNANMLTNGYLQIAFVGGQEAKGGLLQGTKDENTVIFRAGQQKDFETFKDELQRRIAASRSSPSVATLSPLDKLEKLAALRDKGIVSQEEFEQKKKVLLAL